MARSTVPAGVAGNFQKCIDVLKNTECSEPDKRVLFEHIADHLCSSATAIQLAASAPAAASTPTRSSSSSAATSISSSPSATASASAAQQLQLVRHQRQLTTATGLLLMFTEDQAAEVRRSAEQQLHRICRAAEHCSATRLLYDLHYELLKNGHHRSLRCAIQLFAAYAGRIRQRKRRAYALALAPLLTQVGGGRAETDVLEALVELVQQFARFLLAVLPDAEARRLADSFATDALAECATKRRCAALNVCAIAAGSRHPSALGRQQVQRTMDSLSQATRPAQLIGGLGLLRQLVPRCVDWICADGGQLAVMQARLAELFDWCAFVVCCADATVAVCNAALEVLAVLTDERLVRRMRLQEMLRSGSGAERKAGGGRTMVQRWQRSVAQARAEGLEVGSPSPPEQEPQPEEPAAGDDLEQLASESAEMTDAEAAAIRQPHSPSRSQRSCTFSELNSDEDLPPQALRSLASVAAGQDEDDIESRAGSAQQLTDDSVGSSRSDGRQSVASQPEADPLRQQDRITRASRMIASRFLLAGERGKLRSDAEVRVTVKNLGLQVIGNCVRVAPSILLQPVVAECYRREEEEEKEADSSMPTGQTAVDQVAAPSCAEPPAHLHIIDDHFGLDATAAASPRLSLEPLELLDGPEQSPNLSELSEPEMMPAEEVAEQKEEGQPELEMQTDGLQSREAPVKPRAQSLMDLLIYCDNPDPVLCANVMRLVGSFCLALAQPAHRFVGDAPQEYALSAMPILERTICDGMIAASVIVVKQALVEAETLLWHSLGWSVPARFAEAEVAMEAEARFSMPLVERILNRVHDVFGRQYWVVQCRYCQLVGELPFEQIEWHLGGDRAQVVQTTFLNHLYANLIERDPRVRTAAATALCSFIRNASHISRTAGRNRYTPFAHFNELASERVFANLPVPLRHLVDAEAALVDELSDRQLEQRLARVQFRLTNELLRFGEKHEQLGRVSALLELCRQFPPVRHRRVYAEFNLLPICGPFMVQNYVLGTDLVGQHQLFEICISLMAHERPGSLSATVELLLAHTAKLLNIYQHLVTGTKPLFFPRGQKPDYFSSARELLASQAVGYFGNNYFYLHLHDQMAAAFHSYRQHVGDTHADESPIFPLLRSCLRSLQLVLELKSPVATREPIRLIEELLGYLGTVLPYAPHEAIACVRHLLRFMFARNFACRYDEYAWFLRCARPKAKEEQEAEAEAVGRQLAERFAGFRQFLGNCCGDEADPPTMLGLNIKIFEPLVIQCMKLFQKDGAATQADILEMIGEILRHRVSYRLLDANGLFIEFVFKQLDAIEAGTVQHSERLVPSVFRFLFHLVRQRDEQLISIPKIINVCDNLLANKQIFEAAALALNELAFEFFFRTPMAADGAKEEEAVQMPRDGPLAAVAEAEMAACTQREVVVSMLVKYMETEKIHRSIRTIMLLNRSSISDTEVLVNLVQLLQKKSVLSAEFLQSSCFLLSLLKPESIRGQLAAIFALWSKAALSEDAGDGAWAESSSTQLQAILLEHCILVCGESAISQTLDARVRNEWRDRLPALGIQLPLPAAAAAADGDGDDDEAAEAIAALVLAACLQRSLQSHVECLSSSSSSSPPLVNDDTTAEATGHSTTSDTGYITSSRSSSSSSSNSNNCDAAAATFNTFLTVVGGAIAANRLPRTISAWRTAFLLRPDNRQQRLLLRHICSADLQLACRFIDLLIAAAAPAIGPILRLFGKPPAKVAATLAAAKCGDQPALMVAHYYRVATYAVDQLSAEHRAWSESDFQVLLATMEPIVWTDALRPAFLRNSMLTCGAGTMLAILAGFDRVCCSSQRLANPKVALYAELLRLAAKMDGMDNGRLSQMCANLRQSFPQLLPDDSGDKQQQQQQHQEKQQLQPNSSDTPFTASAALDDAWLITEIRRLLSATATSPPPANLSAHTIASLLLQIKSESHLAELFASTHSPHSAVAIELLAATIQLAGSRMLAAFDTACAQHQPHIDYLKVAAPLPICVGALQRRLADANDGALQLELLLPAIVAHLQLIGQLQQLASRYVDTEPVQRFIRRHLDAGGQLLADHGYTQIVPQLLHAVAEAVADGLRPRSGLPFARLLQQLECAALVLDQQPLNSGLDVAACLRAVHSILVRVTPTLRRTGTSGFRRCLNERGRQAMAGLYNVGEPDKMQIGQRAAWMARFVLEWRARGSDAPDEDGRSADVDAADDDDAVHNVMNTLVAIGVRLLQSIEMYAFAIMPTDLCEGGEDGSAIGLTVGRCRSGEEQQQKQQQQLPSCRLPSISIERLNDAVVLLEFVRRINLFGFSSRQHFEELFMTLLMLFNTKADVNMIDAAEQFEIKSLCLATIVELLITCKMHPRIGERQQCVADRPGFIHIPRSPTPQANSIGVRKLHHMLALLGHSRRTVATEHGRQPVHLFCAPNLERHLLADRAHATHRYAASQISIATTWQRLEEEPAEVSASAGGATATTTAPNSSTSSSANAPRLRDVRVRNHRTALSAAGGLDVPSSVQMLFDLLRMCATDPPATASASAAGAGATTDDWALLVLPHLAAICELCETREQFHWMRAVAVRLRETVPLEQAHSHAAIVYCLCRSTAVLNLPLAELQLAVQHVQTVCLRSSHRFVRCAALRGLLALAESYAGSNTAIGRLSDELQLVRGVAVPYVTRHVQEMAGGGGAAAAAAGATTAGATAAAATATSDEHARLVWALTWFVLETTSKFCADCTVLGTAVVAAAAVLRRMENAALHVAILSGLQRLVVMSAATAGPSVGVVPAPMRDKIERLAMELVRADNEEYALPALELLVTCIYIGSADQLHSTELANGIVQDEPDITILFVDKLDLLMHKIRTAAGRSAPIYGACLGQLVHDFIPPSEILTKCIKELLTVSHPYPAVIAHIVCQVFRATIDAAYLSLLQDWLICSLPSFLALPTLRRSVWSLTVIFVAATLDVQLLRIFDLAVATLTTTATAATVPEDVPEVAVPARHLDLLRLASRDFYQRLNREQRQKFLVAVHDSRLTFLGDWLRAV